MSVVPRERAGAGSALTNTARQVSGALGVAVLGSILAQAYRNQLGPHLSALPAGARNAATSSITASQAVAAKLGPAGRDLAAFADTSFVHAMHLTTLISAAITLLGALVVMRWMPGRAAAGAAPPGPAGAAVAARQAGASRRGRGGKWGSARERGGARRRGRARRRGSRRRARAASAVREG